MNVPSFFQYAASSTADSGTEWAKARELAHALISWTLGFGITSDEVNAAFMTSRSQRDSELSEISLGWSGLREINNRLCVTFLRFLVLFR